MADMHYYAIEIATRYGSVKAYTLDESELEVLKRLDHLIKSKPGEYSYFQERSDYEIFMSVDGGKIALLENEYDNLRKEFKERFCRDECANYDPLVGRKGDCPIGSDLSLNLTVDGVSYEFPRFKPLEDYKKYQTRYYLFVITIVVLIALLESYCHGL